MTDMVTMDEAASPPRVVIGCTWCAAPIEADAEEIRPAMIEHVAGHTIEELHAPIVRLSEQLRQLTGDCNVLAARTVAAEKAQRAAEAECTRLRVELAALRPKTD